MDKWQRIISVASPPYYSQSSQVRTHLFKLYRDWDSNRLAGQKLVSLNNAPLMTLLSYR